MKNPIHKIKAFVWIYPGDTWHFISIEKDEGAEIKADYPWPRRGFGAIPVQVTIEKTTWKTSVFPEKEVRVKEGIRERDEIEVRLEVVG